VQAVRPNAPVNNNAEAARETSEALRADGDLALALVGTDSNIFPIKLILFLHPADRAALHHSIFEPQVNVPE
jgi:hypothetical protein